MKKNTFYLFILLGLLGLNWNAHAQTTVINGLAVIVNFPDRSFHGHADTVSMMMNQSTGFNTWNNNGSVKQYYNAQSGGSVEINSQVITVTVDQNYNYYHGSNLPYNGGVEFVKDVVAKINTAYSGGFSGLTSFPSENRLWHFSIICTSPGPNGIGVAYGFDEGLSILNGGNPLPVKNVAVMAYVYPQKPEINVICHELGHSIFGWSDYYNVSGISGNLGHYCLMGSGGNNGQPMHLSAPLRLQKGWIGQVDNISTSVTQTYSATSSNSNQVYKYTNPFNSKEYFLLEPYTHSTYYLSLTGDGYVPDQGLAVWYVDEDGGLDQPTHAVAPRIKLIQADGFDEMHSFSTTHYDQRGDATDLFDNSYASLSDASHPFLRWKDGSLTGLNITDVSAVGSSMTFKVNARPNTISVSPSANGNVSPSGLITVATGQNQTLTIQPDLGYEVDQVLVNGVSQGAVTSYTFNNVTSNATVQVSFKTSTGYSLPSPWLNTDIGSPSAAGKGLYDSGTFGIVSYGNDIWGGSDQFHFIYRTLSGDGEIIARVAGMNSPSDWSKAGVMIRETLNAGSKHAMFVKTPGNGIANQYRTSTNGGSDNYNPRIEQDNLNWLKLSRSGNTITASYSTNGTSWTTFNTVNISMTSNVYVGLCGSGINSNTPFKPLFDQVSVTGANQAPSVSLTSPSNNALYTAPASVTLTASASDTDGTIDRVEFYEGSNLLTTVYSGSYTYNWTSVAAGSYTLTAKAYDDDNASTTSSSVSITVTGSGTCTAPAWNSSTAYLGNAEVSYGGIRYRANWWTQNQRPDLNNGPGGSGQPWTSLGTCNTRTAWIESNAELLSLAPNPASSQSSLTVNLAEQDEVSIIVMDKLGRTCGVIYQGSLAAGQHTFDVPVHLFPQGLYTVSLRGQKENSYIAFIKQ
ncbi:MAG: hypothetical protein K0R51_706 [Cytophagaceae bacterium]|jgi:M6 family metalloprotease-like protein|nr:hypothetical protein [Cytophagaceae bacterium]